MKKFFALFALLVLAASASALLRPDVRATDYAIGALQPGGNAELTLKIENIGNDDCAEHVNVQAVTQHPLSITGKDTLVLGKVCRNATSAKFDITADDSATLGNQPVTIYITYESEYAAQYSATHSASAKITGSPKLRAQVTSTNPLEVHPKDTASIEVTIDNLGGYKAQALLATLSAGTIDIKAGSRTYSAAELAAHKSAKATYTVYVPKSAAPGKYPMTLVAKYIDENAQQKTVYLPLGLEVSKQAEVSATVQDGKLFTGANSVNVRILLQNTGTATAKKVRVKLIPQFPFATDGSERYIDSMAPGESQPAEATLSVDKEATVGAYAVQLQVSFEDELGQKQQDTVDIALNVPPKGLGEVAMDFWYVFAAIVVGAIIFVRMKGKGKKAAA